MPSDDVQDTWREIESVLLGAGPAQLFALNPPAAEAGLAALERELGTALPAPLKALLRIHDGQQDTAACGVFFGLTFLSVQGIGLHWRNWRSLAEEGMDDALAGSMTSRPPGMIKPVYFNARWLPFTDDAGGNHLGVDGDPDTHGTAGQVIAFGRDEDEKRLLGSSVDDFLRRFLAQLRSVRWSLAKGYWSFEDPAHRKSYPLWGAL
ncbi:KNR4-like cell wall assembly/cell proliferation coordinating protein [Aggregicoccus sp. 17bor-14]|uniref:SMI1/KNR4 family protein n=1 Tax=Myxococcaceae TaxID=31 RepID=UPI00129CCA86|nr:MULTISPECIES: SMI1/KNR4 family protein [Myxococcaceae]MBF5043325.1 SMI1/KNR4 family protein [Simulacricoccus sp. 17bor-14]MRI89084.1 KNR4-like cell wall assembly/cell proliferation coordinating protein [Aggregicoccus sp. 17bor-14]